MVDRITKRLHKLSRADRNMAEQIMNRIKRGDTTGLKIKKLRGSNNIFRVRKGRLRIIYAATNSSYVILDVDLRSDTTYRKY